MKLKATILSVQRSKSLASFSKARGLGLAIHPSTLSRFWIDCHASSAKLLPIFRKHRSRNTIGAEIIISVVQAIVLNSIPTANFHFGLFGTRLNHILRYIFAMTRPRLTSFHYSKEKQVESY